MLTRRKVVTRKQLDRYRQQRLLCGAHEEPPRTKRRSWRSPSRYHSAPAHHHNEDDDQRQEALEIYDQPSPQPVRRRRRRIFRQLDVVCSTSTGSSDDDEIDCTTVDPNDSLLSEEEEEEEEGESIQYRRDRLSPRYKVGDTRQAPSSPRGSNHQHHRPSSPRNQHRSPPRRHASSPRPQQRQQQQPRPVAMNHQQRPTGMFCGWFAKKPPGITVSEEHQLWREAVQPQSQQENNNARPSRSHPVQTIEVVPVEQKFQKPTTRDIYYSEMDGTGMVFAPSSQPVASPPSPAQQPWWKRDEWRLSPGQQQQETQQQQQLKQQAIHPEGPQQPAKTSPDQCCGLVDPVPQLQWGSRPPLQLEPPQPQRQHYVDNERRDERHPSPVGRHATQQQQQRESFPFSPSMRQELQDGLQSDLDESLDHRIARLDRQKELLQRMKQQSQQKQHRTMQLFQARSGEASESEVSISLNIPHLGHDYRASSFELRTNHGKPFVLETMHNDRSEEEESELPSETDLSALVKKRDRARNIRSHDRQQRTHPIATKRIQKQETFEEKVNRLKREEERREQERLRTFTMEDTTLNAKETVLDLRHGSYSFDSNTSNQSPVVLRGKPPYDDARLPRTPTRQSPPQKEYRTKTKTPTEVLTPRNDDRRHKPHHSGFYERGRHEREQPSTRRGRSPVRMYGDPPSPRREDGSPVPSEYLHQISTRPQPNAGLPDIPELTSSAKGELNQLLASLSPRGHNGVTGGSNLQAQADGTGVVLFRPTINIYGSREGNTGSKKDVRKQNGSYSSPPATLRSPRRSNYRFEALPGPSRQRNHTSIGKASLVDTSAKDGASIYNPIVVPDSHSVTDELHRLATSEIRLITELEATKRRAAENEEMKDIEMRRQAWFDSITADRNSKQRKTIDLAGDRNPGERKFQSATSLVSPRSEGQPDPPAASKPQRLVDSTPFRKLERFSKELGLTDSTQACAPTERRHREPIDHSRYAKAPDTDHHDLHVAHQRRDPDARVNREIAPKVSPRPSNGHRVSHPHRIAHRQQNAMGGTDRDLSWRTVEQLYRLSPSGGDDASDDSDSTTSPEHQLKSSRQFNMASVEGKMISVLKHQERCISPESFNQCTLDNIELGLEEDDTLDGSEHSSSILGNLAVESGDKSLYSMLLRVEQKLEGAAAQKSHTDNPAKNKKDRMHSRLHRHGVYRTQNDKDVQGGKRRGLYAEYVKRGRPSRTSQNINKSKEVARSPRIDKECTGSGKVQRVASETKYPIGTTGNKYSATETKTGRESSRLSELASKKLSAVKEEAVSGNRRLDRLRKLQSKVKSNKDSPHTLEAEVSKNDGNRAARNTKLGGAEQSSASKATKKRKNKNKKVVGGMVEVYLQTASHPVHPTAIPDDHSSISPPDREIAVSAPSNKHKDLVRALPVAAKARNAAAAKPGSLLWQATAAREKE